MVVHAVTDIGKLPPLAFLSQRKMLEIYEKGLWAR
jgi:hypothetical protein